MNAYVERVLDGVLRRRGGEQVFLFGPAAEPFWCAKLPVTGDQLHLLKQALSLIEQMEAEGKPKPFRGHDPGGRFSLAALGNDSDLFVVVLNFQPDRVAAEARVSDIREDLLREARPVWSAAARAALVLH